MLTQLLTVFSRDGFPPIEDGIYSIELLNSERAIDIRDPVVVAEF